MTFHFPIAGCGHLCFIRFFLFLYFHKIMSINEQFQAAAQQVNNLPGDLAARHMTELYGLYKQATEGDVNMGEHEVNPTAADHYSRSCHDNSRHCHAKIGYSQDHDHDRQKSNHAQCCAVLVTVNLASTLTAIGLGRRSRGQKGNDRKN